MEDKKKKKKKKKTKNNAQILIAQPSNPSPSRLPFSDLSNATPDSNPKHPQPRPHDFRSRTQILSTSTTSRHLAAVAASSSSSSSSATMAPPSDPHSGRGGGCNLLSLSEQTTVYRRKTASRIEHTQNATSNDALSCPPRRTKTEEIKGKKTKKDDHRVISSAPCKRRKKPENFTLPEDFVREQRDYFAKLDEEELIVEEAEGEPFQFGNESKDKVNRSEDE